MIKPNEKQVPDNTTPDPHLGLGYRATQK
uniref:Uncharacterized protein n=1 Tax=Rhizophora mucronata TaxID=61149 RepID=A0A2P2NI35_RHIMU